MHRSVALSIALVALALPASAADSSDPTWPCVQRKVENLSLGLMWPFPLAEDAAPSDDAQAAAIRELSGQLSLRRIPLEDLGPRIDAFSASVDGDQTALGLVFRGVFDTLSKRRTRIIGGIEDFSLGQIKLAAKIDTYRREMDTILSKDAPDFDRVDVLEETIDWDQVIYSDRQRNITYLCETPTLLERRLFEIAQMLQRAASE